MGGRTFNFLDLCIFVYLGKVELLGGPGYLRREFTEPYKDPGPQLRVRFGFLTLAPQVETPSCSPQAQNKTQKVCNAAKRVVCSPENSRSSPPSWPTSSGKWWTSRKPTAVLLIEVPRTEGRRWRERERERERAEVDSSRCEG